MAKLSTMRARAFALRSLRAAAGSRASVRMAAASARGFSGGTTRPVSPRISFASPTSVAIAGRPHAIPSASAFEKPSPKPELDTVKSAAANRRGTSWGRPRRQPVARGLKIFRPGTNQHRKQTRQLHHRREEAAMVLHRVDACHVSEHHCILRDADLGAHGLAHGRVGSELIDIDAVGDDLRAPRAITQS